MRSRALLKRYPLGAVTVRFVARGARFVGSRWAGRPSSPTVALMLNEAAVLAERAYETETSVAATFPVRRDAAARLIHAEIANPRTRARLIASAVRVLGNEADAEDCVQEALILAARNADQFEGRSSPTSWLFRVVINACRMQRRSARRERRGGGAVHVSVDDLVRSHPIADSNSDPEEAIAARELSDVIADELAQVGDRDALLFRRYVAEDLPIDALAKDVRLTRQAVKSRLFRVRRRLAERLDREGALNGNGMTNLAIGA
jgi:RNA polymerase sigma-70 factor, ECF subfamily